LGDEFSEGRIERYLKGEGDLEGRCLTEEDPLGCHGSVRRKVLGGLLEVSCRREKPFRHRIPRENSKEPPERDLIRGSA
jgi:hypothetical protein